MVCFIHDELFCGWLTYERRFHLIFGSDNSQRFSPLQISEAPQAGFKLKQNLNIDFIVEAVQ